MSSVTTKTPPKLVFSDIDGTLVHYPPNLSSNNSPVDTTTEPSLIHLPPSKTGLRGVISSQTLSLAYQIREKGVPLVLVSGARSTTLFKRLPFLPRADAYVCDNGGRIFYNVGLTAMNSPVGLDLEEEDDDVILVETEEGVFRLKEDRDWRRYIGEEEGIMAEAAAGVGLQDRVGRLWDWGRELKQRGYIIDCEGYETCFRVQPSKGGVSGSHGDDDKLVSEVRLEDLVGGEEGVPEGIESSVNLGSVDYYPRRSGKKNCCSYLAQKFLSYLNNNNELDLLSKYCVCICDDDNDLEMAQACGHAYIPGVSSDSMREFIQRESGHVTVTESKEGKIGEREMVRGTERALELILEEIAKG